MINKTLNKILSCYKSIALLITVFVFSVSCAQNETISDNTPDIPKFKSYIMIPDDDLSLSKEVTKEHQNSQFERKFAQEMVSIGQQLQGNPDIDDVLSVIESGAKSLLMDKTGDSTNWISEKALEYIPQVNNKMANAAIDASSKEVIKGGINIANSFTNSVINSGGFQGGYDLSKELRKMYLTSSLEGIQAAASASTLDILNRLEIEYRLSDSSLEEYSILTMQPIWDSRDLRHNVFAQASYFKKEPDDIFADPVNYRHTSNAGIAYRYITPSEKHMFGINSFFDHQWPYHHSRISVGLDYKNTLVGLSANKYVGLSDWRRRGDGFEEIVLDGEDIEFAGRFPQLPELEFFAKGYHWNQGITQVLNPDGSDIYGYKFTAEYTPINGLTISGSVRNDNVIEDVESKIMLRLNFIFGKGYKYLFKRPEYNLNSVLERRYDKVRRNNDIRVQVRQELGITAVVTYAQGANVSLGQSIAIGTTITTGGSTGDAATVEFGNGARLDLGQSTQVRVEADRLVLITGIIQYTSGTGGITIISVPQGTINLIGTDVDVRVAGISNSLRVRDGAADFTDDTGTTRVSSEELAESITGDGDVPQLKTEGTTIFDTHETESHNQINLVGPEPTNSSSAPYATDDVNVSGTLATGNTLSFTVPLSETVTITGTPQLKFTLGGSDRWADYSSGSGTDSLIFTYTITGSDETLSNIVVDKIEKNAGTLTGSNGIAMIRKVSGSLSGTIPDATTPNFTSSTPADNATNVARNTNIVLNFDEDVQAGSGNIVLTDLSDGSDTRSISIGDAQVSIVGSTLTLNPSSDLDSVSSYEVTFASGVITDTSGNNLAALNSSDLNFTTVDETWPTISTLTATSSGGDPAGIGDVITVTLDASEDLTQSGTPTLTLDIGGTSRTANFSAINSGNAEFTYTVQSGDNDSDGVTVSAITVGPNVLEDSSGNDLSTSFTLPHNLSLNVSNTIMGLTVCPSGDLGDDDVNDDTNHGCARLFGSDPTDMDDVMVFAGNVPGTTTDFFVRRCDQSQTYDATDDRCEYSDGNPTTRDQYSWKNVATDSATVNLSLSSAWTVTEAIDGPGRTATLVADGSGTHPAAETCDALGAGWYLPALSELDVIYANLVATDDSGHPYATVANNGGANSGTTGPLRSSFIVTWWSAGAVLYWSSSEYDSNNAWRMRFDNGNRYSLHSKLDSRSVRCARR